MQKKFPSSRVPTDPVRFAPPNDSAKPYVPSAPVPVPPVSATGPVPGALPFIRSIPGIVFQLDRKGRLSFMNDLGRERFGCDGDVPDTLIGPSGSGSSISFPSLSAYFDGERKHRFKNGKEAWISWSSTIVRDGSGAETGLLCTGVDVTRSRRIRDRASAYFDSLAFLSHAGMFFVKHTAREELYRFIGEQLRRLLGDTLVIVASYDPVACSATVRGLWGGKKETAILQKLLGRQPAGMSFPLPPTVHRIVPGKPLVRIRNVHELSLRSLPPELCAGIERALGLADIYALPISVRNERLGAAVLLTRSRNDLPHRKLIEAFIAQASVALKRVTAAEEVVHAAEEWRATFDSISNILFVTDRDFRVLRVNRACAALRGLKPGDMIGKHCTHIFGSTFFSSHPPLCRQVFDRTAKLHHEFFDPRLQRYYELSLIPVMDGRGEPAKVVHVLKDITERKRAEEISQRDKSDLQRIVREKTEALQGTQRELENARRLSDIGVLAATIAHEIRNPLAAIKTAAYNIRRKSRNPDLERHLANIDRKVMESDQIIRNLLSYSRIKLPNYEWVPVAGVLNECVSALIEKYARDGVRITRDLAAIADTLIEADPVHLRILFTNILDNACQSLEGGKGSVHLSARGDVKELTVAVRDTGAGINAEDLKRISEPFFTTKSRGIGLGLTICHQIANLHHGRILIASEPGKGTTVTVVLPSSRTS